MLAVDEDSAPRSAVGHPMRIALCHKRLDERGGTERDFHLTAKGLRDLGHEIHLFCSELAIEKRQFSAGGFKKAIAVSREVKRELGVAYAVPKHKIAVLYNGVDPQRFHPSLRAKWRNAIRNQWGIPLEATVVLFVGNGFRRMGLDRLLGVWGSASLNDSWLRVVGDDARMRAYKAWATKQAPGRIIFLGRQDKVERFYGAADLLALPSIQEAFGNVLLEALASGLPVVVSS